MEAVGAVAAIAAALIVGAISPGPSFIMVVRTAVALSRSDGLAAAIGMGIGSVVFAVLALFGLQILLDQVAWLYLTLKIVGGLYLIYLGVGLWRGAARELTVTTSGAEGPSQGCNGFARSVAAGLLTQLSNPKTALTFGSIFAALLPHEVPLWVAFAIPAIAFAIDAGWYVIVAVAFSSATPRAAYLRAKRWIDRAAGSIMAALGLRLIADGPRPV